MSNSTLVKKRSFSLPHIYVLMMIIIVLCTIATWLLPAGQFDRMVNEAGQNVAIPGTFHTVESTPVGFFDMMMCIYNGFVDAGGVVFFVFISYASISIMIASGAFNGLVAVLLKVFKGKARTAIIPIFLVVVGSASSTIGLFEEWFPFIPVFVGISIAMGFDAVVGLAIVALGAGMGYSGAAMNPFTMGIAQSIAEVPFPSNMGYRVFSHGCMIVVASVFLVRYALKIQADHSKSLVAGDDFSRFSMSEEELKKHPFGVREALVLCVLVAGIAVIVWGCRNYGWYFTELSAVCMIMGIVSGIIMGDGPNKIAEKYASGFSEVAMACMMIGLARGILMVLTAGNIIDTVVYYFSLPLMGLPDWLAAVAMLVFQTLLNFLIPSGSGQAATTMPIMAPMADLLGLTRDTACLAFQFGDGLSNCLWPTAMVGILSGLAGVKIEKWYKFFVPCFLGIFVVQALLMVGAVYLAL